MQLRSTFPNTLSKSRARFKNYSSNRLKYGFNTKSIRLHESQIRCSCTLQYAHYFANVFSEYQRSSWTTIIYTLIAFCRISFSVEIKNSKLSVRRTRIKERFESKFSTKRSTMSSIKKSYNSR